MTETTENSGEVAEPQLGATDPTDAADLETLWQQGDKAWKEGSGLEIARDKRLHEGMAWCVQLYAAVTRGKANPTTEWWRYLNGKGINKGRKPKLLFHPLIAHFTGTEKRKKTAVSRRAAVLQYHHDWLLDPALPERKRIEPEEVAEWLEHNGGVEGVINTIIKPPPSEAEKQVRRNEGQFWFDSLAQKCKPLATLVAVTDADKARLAPYEGGLWRLALIEDKPDGHINVIGFAADGPVTGNWLAAHAKQIIERLPAECRVGVPVEPPGEVAGETEGGSSDDDDPEGGGTGGGKRRAGRPKGSKNKANDATAAASPNKPRGRPPKAKSDSGAITETEDAAAKPIIGVGPKPDAEPTDPIIGFGKWFPNAVIMANGPGRHARLVSLVSGEAGGRAGVNLGEVRILADDFLISYDASPEPVPYRYSYIWATGDDLEVIRFSSPEDLDYSGDTNTIVIGGKAAQGPMSDGDFARLRGQINKAHRLLDEIAAAKPPGTTTH
jgi:hypothetical protein